MKSTTKRNLVALSLVCAAGTSATFTLKVRAETHYRDYEKNNLLIHQMWNWDKDRENFDIEFKKQNDWATSNVVNRAFNTPPAVELSDTFRPEYHARRRRRI